MNLTKSQEAFQQALTCIPGGVNSPVRAFKGVGGNPIFIAAAKGARITDIDENEYIDFVGSWGPMILGHSRSEVVIALQQTILKGTSYGAPTLLETEMARLICKMMPSIESVRMVNSGTEATMSALRLARGYTGRPLVMKFEGCYHGHGDSFLIKAGSGALTLGVPNSPGVTPGTAKDTLVATYNDLTSVEDLFHQFGNQIAAVIIEPITGNIGVIRPDLSFLQGIRELCTQFGTILLFDEVMTGFRVARGGATELLGVTPDLITLGKIIGGGLPVGAYGGPKDIMDKLSPAGPVYQAGTLSGNPMAMTAGLTTLQLLDENPEIYADLENKSSLLEEGIKKNILDLGFPAVINRVGSMFTLFFTNSEKIRSYKDVMDCNTKNYAAYFHASLQKGIYLAPSQFEAAFISTAHTVKDIEITIEANRSAFLSILGKS